jgi:hypothetical protein
MKSFGVRVPTILKFCLNCDSWKYHICGVTWIERNDLIFRREGWQIEKVQMCILNGLLDYGTASWYNSLGTMKRRPIAEQALLELFDKLWGQNIVICSRIGRFVKWCYDGPCRGFISWLFGLSACCVPPCGLCCLCISSHWIFSFVPLYILVVPVTFGHPWRSCCFCLEKCPGLWLLVVSLGRLQRPERWARHRRSSRAELIPGPVGLNGGPHHRRSGPGGAATRALRLVTDPARHPARRARVRECRAGPGRLSVTDPSSVMHRRSEFIYKIYIHISHLSSSGAKASFMSMSTFFLKRGSSKSRNNSWLNELLLGGFVATNWLASISMNRLPIHGAPPPEKKPKSGPVYPSTRKKWTLFLPIAFSHWLSWFSSPLVPHFHEHMYLIYTIY